MNITNIKRNPFPSPITPAPEKPIFPYGVIGKCSKCGIELNAVMGYYCPKQNCPSGLGSSVSLE